MFNKCLVNSRCSINVRFFSYSKGAFLPNLNTASPCLPLESPQWEEVNFKPFHRFTVYEQGYVFSEITLSGHFRHSVELFKSQGHECGHLTLQREWSAEVPLGSQTIHVFQGQSHSLPCHVPLPPPAPTITLKDQSKKTQAPAHRKHSGSSWKA